MDTQPQETTSEPEAENQPIPLPRTVSNSERWLLGHPLDFQSLWPSKALKTARFQPMEFEEALAILRKESLKRSKWWVKSIQLSLLFLVVSFLLVKFAHNTFLLNHWTSYFAVMFSGIVASQQAKSAAVSIARFDDVRTIGPLAEALWFKDKYVASIAAGALLRLLPRLQASDAFLLSPAQRSCLNRALRGKKTELTLAILKAWEQVGDSNAITDVENLAEGRGAGGRFPKVVTAAKECLPFLCQSAERQLIGSQLLRPTDGNVTPSDTLLRPALPQTSAEPSEQLLRPSDTT